ncbi:hypothetical protein [Arthrobacter pigmenti]
MMNIFGHVPASVVAKIDPSVEPVGGAPWMGALRDIAGMLMFTMIVILVIILLVGVALAVGGKLGHMSQSQSAGFMVIVWGLAGAAVIGSLSGLVYWATGLQLAPATKPAAAVVAPLLGLPV